LLEVTHDDLAISAWSTVTLYVSGGYGKLPTSTRS
jgi:hypothetical protein